MSKDLGLLEFLNDYCNWFLSNELFRIKPEQSCLQAGNTVIFRVSGSSQEEFAENLEAFENILVSMNLMNTSFFYLWESDGSVITYYYGMAADCSTKQPQEQYERELLKNGRIFVESYQAYFTGSSLVMLTDEEKNELLNGFERYQFSGYLEGTPGTPNQASYESAINKVPRIIRKPYRMLVLLKSLSCANISGLTCYLNKVLDEVTAMQSITKVCQRSNRKTITLSNTLNCLASNSCTATDTIQRQLIAIGDDGQTPVLPQRRANEQLLSEDFYRNPEEFSNPDRPNRNQNRDDRLTVSGCELNEPPGGQSYGRFNMAYRNTSAAENNSVPLAINNAETGIGSKNNAGINDSSAHATTDFTHTNFLNQGNAERETLRNAQDDSMDGQTDARSATRSEASSNANVGLRSINDSLSKADTNEEIRTISKSTIMVNSLARDWVSYLTNVVKPQLVNAPGYGLYITGIVLFTEQEPALRQLASLLRSPWLTGSQFVPYRLTDMDRMDERRRAFTQLQHPQYLLDQEERFPQRERMYRSAFTQLLHQSTAYCCNYLSGRTVSYLLQQAGGETEE